MALIDYKILLNREEDEDGRLAIFTRFRSEDAYQPGDELEEVFSDTVYAVDGEHLLDSLFAKFNRGSGTFVGDDRYPQRSLSVGDVVEIAGVRYACDHGTGWKKI